MTKYMATLVFLLFGLIATAQQQEANTLHVIGKAEIEVTPDLFDLNIGFTYTTSSMESSIEQLNEAMDDMIKAITSNTKIKSDSIKTVGFNTYVNDNRYNQNKKTTYTANQSLKLTIRHDQKEIVKLLNLITTHNAKINMNTRSYIGKKAQALAEEKLINMAFAHARYQSKLLANAGEFKVGNVRSVDYTQGVSFSPQNTVRFKAAQLAESADMSFGDFNVEKQKISKQIDVTFYILNK